MRYDVEFYVTSNNRTTDRAKKSNCSILSDVLELTIMARTGYAKGANKGHVTEQGKLKPRPASKKMVRE